MSTIRTFRSVHHVLDAIGPERACETLGVKLGALHNARARGKLPAAWFDPLEKAAGEPLPRELFAWRQPRPRASRDEAAA